MSLLITALLVFFNAAAHDDTAKRGGFDENMVSSLYPVVKDKDDKTANKEVIRAINFDRFLSRWAVDIIGKYGLSQSQSASWMDGSKSYEQILPGHSLDKSLSAISAAGRSFGIDLLGNYYFVNRHSRPSAIDGRIGITTGISYIHREFALSLDNFRVQFKSVDANGNDFKQIITSRAPINESVKCDIINVPLLLCTKYQLPESRIGFFASGGIVAGVFTRAQYSGSGVFDYEAVYKRLGGTWIYDPTVNLPVTDGTQVLLTQDYILAHNPTLKTTIGNYFDQLHDNEGRYNVGLGKSAGSNGSVRFTRRFALGMQLQAGMSYQLSHRTVLNIGGSYISQTFRNNEATSQLTNKMGEYNSMLKSAEQVTLRTAGLMVGVRMYIHEDWDRDRTFDQSDKCPHASDRNAGGRDGGGNAWFCGCPDTDNDGIPDKEDMCPLRWGPACAMGCPDRDQDCVADTIDKCPDVAGSETNYGCREKISQPKGQSSGKMVIDYLTVINFSKKQLELDNKMRSNLDTVMARLANDDRTNVLILEYAKGMRAPEFVDASFDRATNIRDYMSKNGISESKLVIGNSRELTSTKVILVIYGENLSVDAIGSTSQFVAQPDIIKVPDVVPERLDTSNIGSGTTPVHGNTGGSTQGGAQTGNGATPNPGQRPIPVADTGRLDMDNFEENNTSQSTQNTNTPKRGVNAGPEEKTERTGAPPPGTAAPSGTAPATRLDMSNLEEDSFNTDLLRKNNGPQPPKSEKKKKKKRKKNSGE